jgi:2-C-methyl-D-erythritol 4-phosphate cytidylyltransferase
MSVWAVLAAAGRGERLGSDRPKAFARLGGRPLLAESLERLENSDWIDRIVIAAPPDWEEPSILVAEEIVATKVHSVVTGGASRSQSVRLALEDVPDDAAVVLVHDAARPLVETTLIEAVARAARESGAAIPVLELTDTIKKMRDGRVRETVDRSELAAAQTPQGFRFGLLVRAYEAAFRDRVTLTDEAMAVERVGEAVVAVPGSARNRKITTPEDLAWAEVELARTAPGP